jgi:hypothetical protein
MRFVFVAEDGGRGRGSAEGGEMRGEESPSAEEENVRTGREAADRRSRSLGSSGLGWSLSEGSSGTNVRVFTILAWLSESRTDSMRSSSINFDKACNFAAL